MFGAEASLTAGNGNPGFVVLTIIWIRGRSGARRACRTLSQGHAGSSALTVAESAAPHHLRPVSYLGRLLARGPGLLSSCTSHHTPIPDWGLRNPGSGPGQPLDAGGGRHRHLPR